MSLPSMPKASAGGGSHPATKATTHATGHPATKPPASMPGRSATKNQVQSPLNHGKPMMGRRMTGGRR